MGTLDNEFVKFGRTVAEVMQHHGKADSIELNANLGFVLLDKEERKGVAVVFARRAIRVRGAGDEPGGQ
jgi:hypothetical protein